MNGPVLDLRQISKSYGDTRVLHSIDLTVTAGEMLAIVGPSGSGKSTMLNIMGTLDRPTSGSLSVAGHSVDHLSDDGLAELRALHIGFVFQHFHLAAGATAVENVADGLLYSGVERAERRRRAAEALERVGLSHRLTHRPPMLSGGEKQRVAMARAIVRNPSVLLADEPTGALDSASGANVLAVLRELNADGTTVVVITHDRDLAGALPRSVRMLDGHLSPAPLEPTGLPR
ncbi:ABC transporter ATP-binding protein [Frondihabitans sp. 4ASC-45]|uniref:ABC transporter ATP-binding protein n=1 Tax=Frondihabitans sp. 4ASC-45 TaxID=3111636 RepID=UPI003C149729